MDAKRIEELRKLHRKAWNHIDYSTQEDIEFAVRAMPELLDEIERLQTVEKEYHSHFGFLYSHGVLHEAGHSNDEYPTEELRS